jgi:hypothetical protein
MEYAAEAMVETPRKKKKINFFKKWIVNIVKDSWESERNNAYRNDIVGSKQLSISREPTSIDQPDRAIQFTVYNANGGRVVETRRYDRQKDRNHQSLYVITSDQEFGKEIDKIITMEALR